MLKIASFCHDERTRSTISDHEDTHSCVLSINLFFDTEASSLMMNLMMRALSDLAKRFMDETYECLSS
jgi:hypothetical protein